MEYDLIVIGAGPAGISASIYAASRGVKVLVLEKNVVGGIIGIVYIGTTPNTYMYEELDLVEHYIPVNEKMETNIKGVYAAGDIRVKQVRQVTTAVSDGAIAGINAAAYIESN